MRHMPKTNASVARELARLSTDCSFLLTHLVRQNDGRSDQKAKGILESILSLGRKPAKPLLKCSSIGWYSSASGSLIYNPESGKFDSNWNSKAVCFTESTLAGLRAHRDVFCVKYGIAFDRDWLFKKGANPCLNIRESLFRFPVTVKDEWYERRIYNFMPPQLIPFINVIHDSFDATHEREWRLASDLFFTYSEVMFIFCCESDFSLFSRIQVNGKPVLFDLAWLDRV
jgi:hypothetical protein